MFSLLSYRESRSAIEAYANGAKEGFVILIQASIALLAGVALLSLIDGTMIWTGARVGIEDLSFGVRPKLCWIMYDCTKS